MPEVRIDPLTGLKAIHAADPAAALAPDAPAPAPQAARQLLQAAAASGVHERIPGPRPGATLAELGPAELATALETWRVRLRAHGDAAHVHLAVEPGQADAELLALPFVPAQVARERERFAAYAAANFGSNLLADLVQEEVKLGERLVAIDDEAVLLAPWASRVPYELTLVPRRPRARFEDDGPLGAGLLADALRRLGAVLGAPAAVAAWVRTAPRGADPFCWHLDLLPQPPARPGLVLGTGVHVTAVTPERAAAALRDA